jgi:hypothetical protein
LAETHIQIEKSADERPVMQGLEKTGLTDMSQFTADKTGLIGCGLRQLKLIRQRPPSDGLSNSSLSLRILNAG